MKAMTKSERTIREYGFDVYALQDAIREHTEWLKSLSPEDRKRENLRVLKASGIVDENGMLAGPYRPEE